MAKKRPPVKKAVGKSEWKPTPKRRGTRLPDDTNRQAKVQQALYEIADAASAVMDMQKFYAALHRIVGKLMYAKNFYVTLYDPATQMISAPYFVDEAGDVLPPPAKLDKSNRSLRAYVLHTGKTLHVSAEEIEDGRRRGKFTPMGTPAVDWIGVPLKIAGKTIGSLTIQSYKKGVRYTEHDVQLLEFVARHIAVALTRARAIEETRQRNAELAIINAVQSALAAELDIQGIYNAVGEKLREIFRVQTVAIYSADLKSKTIRLEYGFEKGKKYPPMDLSFNSLYEQILSMDKTFVLNGDFSQFAAKYSDYRVPAGAMPTAVLITPVIRKKDSNQVVKIGLFDIDSGKIFSDTDIRLVETLANSMSIALENAQLWEQEKLYRKALERELEIGREIQAGFLPDVLPLVEGWEIAASLISAREVAGDFYDAFELPDGNIGLVIADVCDKGVGAALFMTLFRSLIRAAANLDAFEGNEQANVRYSVAERLQRAISLTNNYIAKTHGESGMFATLFFGILDPHIGMLTYINGGHEPPFIVHPGNMRESLYNTGPALGAIPDCHFDINVVQLNPGDMLFAFTDGVPDAKNPQDESFGHRRLLEILQRDNNSSHELIKTVERELHQYIAGSTQFDDITLLALRRRS